MALGKVSKIEPRVPAISTWLDIDSGGGFIEIWMVVFKTPRKRDFKRIRSCIPYKPISTIFELQDCGGLCHPVSQRMGNFQDDKNASRNLMRVCDLDLAPEWL